MTASTAGPQDWRTRLAQSFSRLSTGIKMLLLITLALLPLGLIALLASLQASRSSDLQLRAELNVAMVATTRILAVELTSDLVQVRSAVNAIAAGGDAAAVCRKTNAVINARGGVKIAIALFGTDATPICATAAFRPDRPPRLSLETEPEVRLLGEVMEVSIPSQGGGAVAVLRYPVATLTYYARPNGFVGRYRLTLDQGFDALALVDNRESVLLQRVETVVEPVGLYDLTLTMMVERNAFNATEALLTFLPLLMWASAAAIGFLVVDRLLIRPLRTLRESVASYVPGEPFVLVRSSTPALEIRELGETFERLATDLASHEADLDQSFADQVRLTREVHHRVKNNLQVIASLISLHARAAESPEATTAYASIQRRVDAMSIVHRNHYAEQDPARGIPLKTLLGELAASLRSSVPGGAIAPAISVATPAVPVAQDSAIPIAFIVTELTELSMLVDPRAAIAITVEATEIPERALLRVESTALRSKDEAVAHGGLRYGRIVEALARQLRAPLQHDPITGYAVLFPTGPGRPLT